MALLFLPFVRAVLGFLFLSNFVLLRDFTQNHLSIRVISDAEYVGNKWHGDDDAGSFLIQPHEYLNFDQAICQGHDNFTLPKPRVEDPVYYASGKFRVGSRRWNDALTMIGCRVLLSNAIPANRIRIPRDEFPQSIIRNGRYKQHLQFVRNDTHESGRGAGFWFWKPLLNLALLNDDSVPDGAYVVYSDGDRPDVIGFAGEVIEAMALRGHDFAIQHWKGDDTRSRTKGDTFVYFGFTNMEEWENNSQYSANFFIYRKSAEMVRFFNEWARLMEDYHQVSDEPSIVANHPHYDEHRHDQTMLDLLIKYGYNDGIPGKERLTINMEGRPHISRDKREWLSGLRTFTLSLETTALPKFRHGPYRNELAETQQSQKEMMYSTLVNNARRWLSGLRIFALSLEPTALIKFRHGPHRNELAENTQQEQKEMLYSTLLKNADRKIAERRAWLSNGHSEGTQFGALANGGEMWYLFGPNLPCMWTFEKEPSCTDRHDGGKWLCGLREVHAERRQQRSESAGETTSNADGYHYGVGRHYDKQPCIVYSMGSNDDFSFEERVREEAPGCEIHTFDPTIGETGRGKPFYDSYHGDYGFGGRDTAKGEGQAFPVKSINTIMRELDHIHVDYLKIDVEGYEWEFFDAVDWSVTKVGQLLVEVHPFAKYGVDAKKLDAIFTKLEMAGFRLISLEPVTYTNFGQVEHVFIHKDWRPDGKW